MQPWQQRVIREEEKLRAKTVLLRNFMQSDLWEDLDPGDRVLLCQQISVMEQYLEILAKRIMRFTYEVPDAERPS